MYSASVEALTELADPCIIPMVVNQLAEARDRELRLDLLSTLARVRKREFTKVAHQLRSTLVDSMPCSPGDFTLRGPLVDGDESGFCGAAARVG